MILATSFNTLMSFIQFNALISNIEFARTKKDKALRFFNRRVWSKARFKERNQKKKHTHNVHGTELSINRMSLFT